ncbi:MAG: hypothetical protein VYC34_00700 [Planctomycetota bacterium]|nr:hypothetical protein [Planctomycetota bacterium]
MALFGSKKGKSETADDAENGKSSGKFESNPANASRFFNHARAMHEASNFEYAMTLWLDGLRWDPSSMSGLEHFYESAQAYSQKSGKKSPTKDQVKAVKKDKKHPADSYLLALLEWGPDPTDAGAGVKALDAASKLDLDEAVHWIGLRTLNAARAGAKPKKDLFVKMKDIFVKVQAYDLAVKAGEDAMALDPSDTVLQAEVRNLSAQAAMSKGGYENTQEGSFRQNIRDLDKQRQLESETSVVRTEEATDRLVENAREDYESRPTDTASIQKYAKTLLSRGTPEDEKTAVQVLLKGYEQTREFRFREQAGAVQIRRARRKLRAMKEKAASEPQNAELQAQVADAEKKILEGEVKELQLQVEAYPTDLHRKFELGRRLFLLGQQEEAIGLFQESRRDAKARVPSLNYLGQAFLKLGWITEAIESLRTALEAHHSEEDDLGMELRYLLMLALAKRAEQERDAAAIDEAIKIASSLAMQNIGYRDIRSQREALQKLSQELKAEKQG